MMPDPEFTFRLGPDGQTVQFGMQTGRHDFQVLTQPLKRCFVEAIITTAPRAFQALEQAAKERKREEVMKLKDRLRELGEQV